MGRDTSVDGSETRPAKVDGLPKIAQVCAGDSHTAALSEDGRVFIWGNFRVSLPKDQYLSYLKNRAPDKVHIFISVMPISSPNPMFDHLLELSHCGNSYKWSNRIWCFIAKLAYWYLDNFFQ